MQAEEPYCTCSVEMVVPCNFTYAAHQQAEFPMSKAGLQDQHAQRMRLKKRSECTNFGR